MMRRTAACAGLALAIYLSAWTTIEQPSVQMLHPISFDGIDAVVFQGFAPSIHFSSSRSEAESDSADFPGLVELRKGRVLVLRTESKFHRGWDIYLPPSVKRLVALDPSIVVEEGTRMEFLEVRVSSDMDWKGDIPTLVVIDEAQPQECQNNFCGNRLEIRGAIGDLRVSTNGGNIDVQEADDVGRITLRLGPAATYSLHGARRPAKLRVLPVGAGANDEPKREQHQP